VGPVTPAAGQDEDLAAYLAATADDQPPDEDAWMWIDPDGGPPMGEDFWLGQLAHEQLAEVLAERAATVDPPVVLPFLDDVTDRDSTGSGGVWFGAGSVLDQLEPGPVLARALEEARDAGLGRLSDDELAGMMLAGRRLESRGTAALLAATAELDRRRRATGDVRVVEHIDNEVAI
jgi:hypothetical protein